MGQPKRGRLNSWLNCISGNAYTLASCVTCVSRCHTATTHLFSSRTPTPNNKPVLHPTTSVLITYTNLPVSRAITTWPPDCETQSSRRCRTQPNALHPWSPWSTRQRRQMSSGRYLPRACVTARGRGPSWRHHPTTCVHQPSNRCSASTAKQERVQGFRRVGSVAYSNNTLTQQASIRYHHFRILRTKQALSTALTTLRSKQHAPATLG